MSLTTERENQEDASVLRLALEQSPEAPALGRAAITGFLEHRGIDSTVLATLTLLVSEIVTNAVVHPDVDEPNKIDLYARITPELIRVEVTDRGSGFTPRPRDPAQIGGGYGLHLVDKASSRWGVDTGDDTTVWFELTTRPT